MVFSSKIYFSVSIGICNRYCMYVTRKITIDDWRWFVRDIHFRGRDRKMRAWMREWLCKRIPDGRRTTRVRKRTRKVTKRKKNQESDQSQRKTVYNKNQVKSSRDIFSAPKRPRRRRESDNWYREREKETFARRFLENIWIPILIRPISDYILTYMLISHNFRGFDE